MSHINSTAPIIIHDMDSVPFILEPMEEIAVLCIYSENNFSMLTFVPFMNNTENSTWVHMGNVETILTRKLIENTSALGVIGYVEDPATGEIKRTSIERNLDVRLKPLELEKPINIETMAGRKTITHINARTDVSYRYYISDGLLVDAYHMKNMYGELEELEKYVTKIPILNPFIRDIQIS